MTKKVVLLNHKGRQFTVTESAYLNSRDLYDKAGAVPATEQEILSRESAVVIEDTPDGEAVSDNTAEEEPPKGAKKNKRAADKPVNKW